MDSFEQVMKSLCHRNYRGWSLTELILEMQENRDIAETIIKYPDADMFPDLKSGGFWASESKDEYLQQTAQIHLFIVEDIIKEIDRRRSVVLSPTRIPDKEIIQTLKERMPVADALEWYTTIEYSSRDQMKFRCILHGEDKNPSGVIYVKESRWWCFACGKGGDVIDAVEQFGKLSKSQAIKQIAEHLGIDTKPIKKIVKRIHTVEI